MNMMRIFYIGLSGVGMMFSSMASGNDAGGLQSPACGVVCDPYICVSSDGISPAVNKEISRRKKPLKTYNHYKATIPANLHSLTVYFAMLKKNYVRDDRYFGVDGKRSGKINQTTTKMLFMCRE
ncbi:YcgJ family protein [Escherichia coli]|uniref:YcgJ family protein n=1 Tax=Escherichia coli TaxID=562 RepID=UPI0010AF73C0|nr:Fels-1 Propage domain-containing protein [Escherichia coli]